MCVRACVYLDMCCSACLCLCATLIGQQLCVMVVIFIRAAGSGMITIWVARFGLGITGHGLISRASPALIMKPVMSDNNHLMEQRRGSSVLWFIPTVLKLYLLLFRSESPSIYLLSITASSRRG